MSTLAAAAWDDALITVGAVVTALTVLVTFAVKTWHGVKSIDAVLGKDADGKTLADHVRSTSKSLDELDTRVRRVEAVLSPPGEDSLARRVDRVEDDVQRIAVKVDFITGIIRREDHP